MGVSIVRHLGFEDMLFQDNEACIYLLKENEKLKWHVGYFRKILSEDTYQVEMLQRVKSDSHLYWKYPNHEVNDHVHKDQILRHDDGKLFNVDGTWDLGSRVNNFCLKQCDDVRRKVENFMKTF